MNVLPFNKMNSMKSRKFDRPKTPTTPKKASPFTSKSRVKTSRKIKDISMTDVRPKTP